MSHAKEAKEIIRILEANRFYAECPCCRESILLKDAGLFYLTIFHLMLRNFINSGLRN